MYQLCRHIKTNGLRCQSPAMRTSAYCYFHTRLIKTATTPISFMDTIQLPPLEDRASILLAITQVLNALLGSRIDDRRARVLLYALQIASQNMKRIEKEQDKGPLETVREVERTEDGEDLAPVLSVCEPQDCALCPRRSQCSLPLDSIPEAPVPPTNTGAPGPSLLGTRDSKLSSKTTPGAPGPSPLGTWDSKLSSKTTPGAPAPSLLGTWDT